MDISYLAAAFFIGFLTILLVDFRKLLTHNIKKLDPKYMNDYNTVKGTRLEIDKNGNTIIIPTRRYSLNQYL